MLIGRAKDGFSVYLNPGEEEKMALDIIERCEIGCVSITVVDDDGTLMDALWGGLKRAVERKNTDLCDDILGGIRYIDSERMKRNDNVYKRDREKTVSLMCAIKEVEDEWVVKEIEVEVEEDEDNESV